MEVVHQCCCGLDVCTVPVHTLLVIGYHILNRPVEYRELGPDYFDKLHLERSRRKLVKRLEALEFHVTLQPALLPI